MNWPILAQPSLAWMSRLPVRRINQILTAVFFLLCSYFLARFTWQVVPLATPPALPLPAAQQLVSLQPDLGVLLAANLFGKAGDVPVIAAPKSQNQEAPKTTLNLKLAGIVVVKGKPELGAAIIESQGAQQTYGADERIEGTNATLGEVLEDRVLISINGRFETLMLDGVDYQQMATETAAPVESVVKSELPEAQINETSASLGSVKEELLNEPMKFFDYVRISPEYRQGALQGYRLTPGKDPAFFEQMGLKTGDVAIEINGTPLNDLQQASVVMRELREATEVSIKLVREGQTQDVVLSLSKQ